MKTKQAQLLNAYFGSTIDDDNALKQAFVKHRCFTLIRTHKKTVAGPSFSIVALVTAATEASYFIPIKTPRIYFFKFLPPLACLTLFLFRKYFNLCMIFIECCDFHLKHMFQKQICIKNFCNRAKFVPWQKIFPSYLNFLFFDNCC